MLLKAHEWSFAHIVSLGQGTDAIAGGSTLAQHLVNLGGFFFGDLQAERLTEFTDDAVETIDGIADGNVGTFFIESHRLAPEILHNVIGEVGSDGIGGSWAPLDHVRHLTCGEIRINGRFVTLCRGTHGCHHHGNNHH